MTTATATADPAGARRRLRLGFRARVLGSLVALVAATTAGWLIVQRALLLERLEREVGTALEQARDDLATLVGGVDPTTGRPFAGDVRAIFDSFLATNAPRDGQVFITFVGGSAYKSTLAPLRLDQDPALVARWGALTSGNHGRLDTPAGPVRYLAVPLVFDGTTEGTFVVAHFLRGERDEIDAGIRLSAVVAAGALLAATAVAWLVAGRLLRPVRRLTETAETIGEGNLSARIPVEGDDEIARLAATFNHMLDRLEDAFRMQRRFLDDAGHELRTPITVVRGHLEVMADDPDERRATLALVTDELDRMARIVDDLLVLAKAEQPHFLHLDTVEAADLTADLLANARALGPRDWRLDACATGELRADRQRVTQAGLNLVRNAIEHTEPDDEVGIGSAWADDGLRLWVRDTGPGVDRSDHDRIFERFTRGGVGPRRSEGAGLGLAIVASVAEAHGGRVELDSRPGQGATFTIVLPGAPPPPPPPSPYDDTVEIEIAAATQEYPRP